MPELTNSVIMPREDFLELSEAAWNQPPATVKERALTTASTTLILAACAGAVTVGTYGWARAQDWLETRRVAREMLLIEKRNMPHKTPKQ